MSAASIDRLLVKERAALMFRGRSHTKPGTLLKSQIPIPKLYGNGPAPAPSSLFSSLKSNRSAAAMQRQAHVGRGCPCSNRTEQLVLCDAWSDGEGAAPSCRVGAQRH